MLFKGLMVTALSGTLDGLIASHNRGGYYFKQYVIPVDPDTTGQQYCRDAMTATASAWNALTPAKRREWENYARTLSVTNRIGDRITITGRAAFCREILPRVMKNNALDDPTTFPDTDPPLAALVDFPSPPHVTITDATHFNLIWPSPMGWENTAADNGQTGVIVHFSGPKPVTRNWCKGPYIPAFWLEADEDTPPSSPHACDITTSSPTVVPHFVTGKRYFYLIRHWREQHNAGAHFRGFVDATF